MTPVILPPSAGTSTPPVTAAGHSAVLATVPDAPPAAARLDPGSVVTGTVLGRDSQGLVNIRTDKGVLALQTNANLPVGSTVSLEVRVAGARLQLVVLSVELPPGQGPAPGAGAMPAGGTPAPVPVPPAPLTPSQALALALTGGALVMATVVHDGQAAPAGRPGDLPPQNGAPLPGQVFVGQAPAGQAPPGQAVSGQAQPVTLPGGAAALVPSGHASPGTIPPGPISTAAIPIRADAAGPLPRNAVPASGAVPGVAAGSSAAPPATASGATPGPMPPAGTPSAPPPTFGTPVIAGGIAAGGAPPVPGGAGPAPPAAQPQPLPGFSPGSLNPGSEIAVRILGAALPGEPAPTAGARPPGALPLVQGTVMSRTPSGQPVVDTPVGPMVLAVKGSLPVGATLLMEIPLPLSGDPALGPPISSPQQALLRLFRGWPTLGGALAALGAAGDAANAQALAARLPQTGPGLASGLLAAIAQFAADDSAAWLSPALRDAFARIGKRELGDRLNAEFRHISHLAAEPSSGDWRVMFLPLRHEGELHQVNLYLRGRRKSDDKSGPDTGTRFVVEVDMTRLGPIQLDGLVQGKRFDLMLRSRLPLPQAARRDIEAIFNEARGLGGFAGVIGFQISASFPVQPLDQAKRKSAAGGVVV